MKHHPRPRWIAVVSALALAQSGCSGWMRASTGYAYSATGRVTHSGPIVGTDTILTPKPRSFWNRGPKPLPVALHVGLESVLAADLKTVGWLTGVAVKSTPRPIGGYAIIGTNGHYDFIGGRSSFGNFHPYAEVGVAAPTSARDDNADGPLLTFGLEYMLLVSYLAQPEDRVSNMLIFKFGFAWEAN